MDVETIRDLVRRGAARHPELTCKLERAAFITMFSPGQPLGLERHQVFDEAHAPVPIAVGGMPIARSNATARPRTAAFSTVSKRGPEMALALVCDECVWSTGHDTRENLRIVEQVEGVAAHRASPDIVGGSDTPVG